MFRHRFIAGARYLALVASFMVASMVASHSLAQTTVQIENGPIEGTSKDGLNVFLGIPYAAPVIGVNRWRPPQPVANWQTPRSAREFGPACPQPARGDRDTGIRKTDENCLTLNIWAASDAKAAPVMVWLHGGAFRVGSASQKVYDGSSFANAGVVLVSIEYRLGRLGFFTHPALEEGGNLALMDQVAALQWVQRNIAQFGGDPENVTVFGESAGGASIVHLLTSPRAAGTFHKAIIQSGGGHQIDAQLAQRRGMKPSLLADSLKLAPADDTAQQLLALSIEQILSDGPLDSIGSIGPVIDGDWVTDDPGALLARGEFNKVPVLVGANSNEASVLAAFGASPEQAVKAARVNLEDFPELYRGPQAAAQAWGDAAFVAGARHVARSVAAHGGTSYLYHFDYVLERRRNKVPGASHGTDVIFVFNNLDVLPFSRALVTDNDREFADQVQGAWVRFARSGNPNGGGLPNWPAYDIETDQTMYLGPTVSAQSAFRKPQLDFHDQRWEQAEALLHK